MRSVFGRLLHRPRWIGFGFVAAAAVAGALLVLAELPSGSADPFNARQVATGAAVYERACAGCHGRNLKGQPNWETQPIAGVRPAPPHDMTGHTWVHSDRLLFQTIRFGGSAHPEEGVLGAMPAFAGLSDAEIWAVLAFIKSRWPEDVIERQTQFSRRYRIWITSHNAG
jgi:mono/diheme cytochrome c family protein